MDSKELVPKPKRVAAGYGRFLIFVTAGYMGGLGGAEIPENRSGGLFVASAIFLAVFWLLVLSARLRRKYRRPRRPRITVPTRYAVYMTIGFLLGLIGRLFPADQVKAAMLPVDLGLGTLWAFGLLVLMQRYYRGQEAEKLRKKVAEAVAIQGALDKRKT